MRESEYHIHRVPEKGTPPTLRLPLFDWLRHAAVLILFSSFPFSVSPTAPLSLSSLSSFSPLSCARALSIIILSVSLSVSFSFLLLSLSLSDSLSLSFPPSLPLSYSLSLSDSLSRFVFLSSPTIPAPADT